jgi:hypothetical protein
MYVSKGVFLLRSIQEQIRTFRNGSRHPGIYPEIKEQIRELRNG